MISRVRLMEKMEPLVRIVFGGPETSALEERGYHGL